MSASNFDLLLEVCDGVLLLDQRGVQVLEGDLAEWQGEQTAHVQQQALAHAQDLQRQADEAAAQAVRPESSANALAAFPRLMRGRGDHSSAFAHSSLTSTRPNYRVQHDPCIRTFESF